MQHIRNVKIVSMRLVFVTEIIKNGKNNNQIDVLLLGSEKLIYLPTDQKNNLKSSEKTAD